MSDLHDASTGSGQLSAPRGHTPDIEDILNLEPDENDLLNPSNTDREGCPSESLLNSDRGTDDTRSDDSSSSDSEGKSETDKMVARKVKMAIDKYVKSLNREREKKKKKKRDLKAKATTNATTPAATAVPASPSPAQTPPPAPPAPATPQGLQTSPAPDESGDPQRRKTTTNPSPRDSDTDKKPDETPTYRSIKDIQNSRRTTKNLFGGHERIPRTGSVRNEGDMRPILTRETSDKRACQNCSFSYTYRNLYCDSCANPHPILGKNIRPVFILADQNFPAAIPVQDGKKCLAIARIEDGTLSELVDLFLKKVRIEWLPADTIVMLASASHLARCGTSAYAEDFVHAKNRLEAELPAGCLVLHAPVFLLAGCTDAPLIRSLYEICQWLVEVDGRKHQAGDLSELYLLWTDIIHDARTGDKQEQYGIRIQMPDNTEYPITRKYWSSQPASALPACTRAISQPLEAKYIRKLVNILNRQLSTQLSLEITCERSDIGNKPDPPKIDFLVFIGGPTASSLYEAAKKEGMEAGLITLGSLDPPSIDYAAKQVAKTTRNLEIDEKTYLLVYCLFETYVYTEENGRRSYITADNIQHLEGPICFGNKDRLEPAIMRALPLYDAAKDAPKVTLNPLPQFANKPCCENPAHATNAGTDAYKSTLKQNLATVGHIIREVISAKNIRKHRTLNTTSTTLDVPSEAAWGSTGTRLTEKAFRATLHAVLSESTALIQKRALPVAGRPPAKRLHSDPGPSGADRPLNRRRESEPEPPRPQNSRENSPERHVTFRRDTDSNRYRY